ncbi:N-acetylmuramidase domain-containing protein [Perlucidibaca piscinae]|uniref:N-acetylmuramidase domain-containing protein n=1 Tax=Perlucidibaca piscinae TaxID=392589 RepID=UPI0003B5E224|nr:N-acetylmuramidase family protein [Perlucidibaca piscinae]
MIQKLTPGSRGQDVSQLQRLLKSAGLSIEIDGDYGDATAAAVRSFQQSAGLVIDGVAGLKTIAALQGQLDARLLTQLDLVRAAETLDVELAAVMAVNAVESNGHGFLANGRPVILFERHIMYRRMKEKALASTEPSLALGLLVCTSRAQPGIVNQTPGGYAGGTAEHQRLAHARRIDDTAALESASWGLFQIMGFHWQQLGYDSVQAFAKAMSTSEGAQLDAFVRLIKADPGLHKALRARRWTDFAKRYNGPDYRKNLYDARLQRAYEEFSEVHAA